MPSYTVPISGPNGPGFITVNASSPSAAIENASQGGDHATGAPIEGGHQATSTGPGGSAVASGGSPTQATTTQTSNANNDALQKLGNQVNSLLGAIASGNKEAFNEAVRQFDLSFGLDKDKFSESVRQFNQNFNIAASGVTGTYGGAPTQQAILQAANIAAQQAGLTGYYQAPNTAGPGAGYSGDMATDAFNYKASPSDQQTYLNAEGGDAAKAAVHYFRDVQGAVRSAVENSGQQWTPAQLQSWVYGTPGAYATGQNAGAATAGTPTLAREQQTYSQQLGLINQAAALQANPFRQQQAMGQMSRLLGGQSVAGFSAPQTVAGVGTAGGNTQGGMGYLQQMIDDIQNPGANQHSMQQVMDAIPTPTKLDSVQFFKAPTSTQNLVLQGMQEKYGLDPADALGQIKNTMPGFQAPATFGTVRRPTF